MGVEKQRREGFWKSTEEPDLPMPVAQDTPWEWQECFLDLLESLEDKARGRYGTITRYRGWSTCRLCGAHNGSVEFRIWEWEWPEGLRHYIEAHNVRPSVEFQEFVMPRPNTSE